MEIKGSMTVKELLKNPKCCAVLNKHLPGIVNHPKVKLAGSLTIQQVLVNAKGIVPAEKVEAILRDLKKI